MSKNDVTVKDIERVKGEIEKAQNQKNRLEGECRGLEKEERRLDQRCEELGVDVDSISEVIKGCKKKVGTTYKQICKLLGENTNGEKDDKEEDDEEEDGEEEDYDEEEDD